MWKETWQAKCGVQVVGCVSGTLGALQSMMIMRIRTLQPAASSVLRALCGLPALALLPGKDAGSLSRKCSAHRQTLTLTTILRTRVGSVMATLGMCPSWGANTTKVPAGTGTIVPSPV